MKIEKEKIGVTAIILISILGITGVFLLDPIAQDLQYHLFKDQRTVAGVPNFWNVISNLPFLVVGVMGLYSVIRSQNAKIISDIKAAYILLFVGVFLVAFGSGYYHLWPSNETLVWDRLPMTIAFMALISMIIAEFVSIRLGKLSFWPLIIFGVFSVVYWHVTEINGEGDLRLYALVQFLPMMVIPLILLFFKSAFTKTRGYWLLLCAYILAKAFEHYDEAIYNFIPFLSGHSIKHLIAAMGVLILLESYKSREASS